jgi:hypothetical protein
LYKIIESEIDDQINYKFRYALIDNDWSAFSCLLRR